jgi:hypothetical protein
MHQLIVFLRWLAFGWQFNACRSRSRYHLPQDWDVLTSMRWYDRHPEDLYIYDDPNWEEGHN